MPCKRPKKVFEPLNIPNFDEIMKFPLAILVEDNYGVKKKMYMDANLDLLPAENEILAINANVNERSNIAERIKRKSTVKFRDENDYHDEFNEADLDFIDIKKLTKKVRKKSFLKDQTVNANNKIEDLIGTLNNKRNSIVELNNNNKEIIEISNDKSIFDLNTEQSIFNFNIGGANDVIDINARISAQETSQSSNGRKSILKTGSKDSVKAKQTKKRESFNVVFSSPLVRHTPSSKADLRRNIMLDQLRQFKATPILSNKLHPAIRGDESPLAFMRHSPTKLASSEIPQDSNRVASLKDYSSYPEERSLQIVKAEDRKKWMMAAKRRSRWIKRAQGMTDSFWEVYNVENSESVILKICGTSSVQTFAKVFPVKARKKIIKIGEGSFGEVFSIMNSENQVVVAKFIPVGGELYYNGGPQTTFDDIISEIVVAKELSDMNVGTSNKCRSFVQMTNVSLVCGKLPVYFQKEWDSKNKITCSENDNPKKFGSNQKWIVLQFEFAGCPLENFQVESWGQAYSILLQTCLALACAENYLEFEHRDLHWGNLLILKKDPESPKDIFIVGGKLYPISHHGVQSTIIDFTFSRIKKGINLVFTDMSKDEDIFLGTGDIQFDVYRQMQEHNRNQWATFNPKTNIFWLSYLSSKLMDIIGTSNLEGEDNRAAFMSLVDEIGRYSSANEVIKYHHFL